MVPVAAFSAPCTASFPSSEWKPKGSGYECKSAKCGGSGYSISFKSSTGDFDKEPTAADIAWLQKDMEKRSGRKFRTVALGRMKGIRSDSIQSYGFDIFEIYYFGKYMNVLTSVGASPAQAKKNIASVERAVSCK